MTNIVEDMIEYGRVFRPDKETFLPCKLMGLSGFTRAELFDDVVVNFDATNKDQIIIDWDGYEISVYLDDQLEGHPMRVRVIDQRDFEETDPFVDTVLPTLETNEKEPTL